MKLVLNISPLPNSVRLLLAGLALLMLAAPLQAEGVQQVAPTADDGPVMLETNRVDFGNFAAFDGPESSRLYITIGDLNEKIYIGLAEEYSDDGEPFPGSFSGQYQFRIRYADATFPEPIVHGPFIITPGNANLSQWSDAVFPAYDTTAIQNGQRMYVFQPQQLGNYYIEFSDTGFQDATADKVNIPYWDITVANDGEPVNGRVWSRNWAFRTPQVDGTTQPECVWDREFNGTFYSYTTDGFVSRINFENAGMQGLSFNVAFNRTGPGNSGVLTEDRKSVPGTNATLNSAQHRIFLSEPDPMLFPDGVCGEIDIPQTFSCLNQDSFCLDITVTKPGQVEIILDFNQNGVLDPDSEDVTLVYEFPDGQLTGCVPWDGLRGDGTPIGVGDTIDLIFQYSQGIQHWSAYDVEFLRNGYCIETVRPICSDNFSSDLLFWDDTNIPQDPGTGAVKDGRNGCDCMTMCRNWDNFSLNGSTCDDFNDEETSGYGDKNTINTWWFANTTTVRSLNIPLILAYIAGPDTICAGDVVEYVATDEGATGNTTYSWTGPNGFMADGQSVMVSEAGEYCVEVSDILGCSSTVCKTLTVLNPDDGSITYPENLTACIGSEVDLIATGNLSGYSFSWSPAGPLGSDANSPSPSFTFTEPITFTVTITEDETDCSFTRTVEVGGRIEPQPNFTAVTGCDQGLSINFVDGSIDAATYLWDFGDPSTTADVSVLPSPSYTYPQAGTYTVVLTTVSTDGCSATFEQEVVVEDIPLIADFTVSYNSCTPDAVEVQFTNTSINGANNTVGYAWTFSNGNGTSDEENPTITITGNQTFTALLTITTAESCTASASQEVTVNLGPIDTQFDDELLVCPGDSVQITPGGAAGFIYAWSPSTGISDVTSPQPIFFPATSTTYTVTVTAEGTDQCEVIETVEVTVPPIIGLEVSGGGNFCTPTTTLTATTDVATTIEWYLGSDLVFTGPVFTPALSGTTTYTVVAIDDSGCSESTTVTVSGGLVDISVPDTVAVCLGEEIMLSVTNLDPNDTLTYLWEPAELFAAGTNTSATPDYIEAIGAEDVTVTVTNQFGCTTQELVHVAVIDPDIMLSFTSEIDCSGGTVTFTNTSTAAFGYVWDFGDGSPLNYEENPVHVYNEGGEYTVTLDIVYDVSCAEPFSADIMVEAPQIFAAFEFDITECSADSAVIQFFDTSVNTLNNTDSWNWTFDTAVPTSSIEQNPSVTVSMEGPLIVSLTIGTANDCDNTFTDTLEIDLVDLDISLADTLVVCLGDSVTLNPDGDPSLTYSWSPVDGLDDPTATSPVATPSATTTYTATAYSTVGADTCFVTDAVVVFVPESIELELDQEPVVVTCGEDVTITATANVDIDVVWISTLEGPLGSGPSITVNPFRTDTIIATATDMFGCTATDSIIVIDNGVDFDVEPGFNITACQGVDTTLTVINIDDEDTLMFEWSPEEYILGPNDGSSVNIEVTEPGTVIFTAIVTNQNDCVDTVEFTVNVLEFDGEVADTVLVCYDEATPLNPGGNPTYIYNWEPTDGLDLSNPENPIATLTENQTYYVTITDPSTTCSDQDSIVVIVQDDLDLMTEGGIQLCEVTPVTLTATTAIPTEIVWYFMGDSIGSGPTIDVLPPSEDGCFTYTAVATDPLTGCSQSSSEEVCLQAFTDELPGDTVLVCADEATPINPNGDPNLVYEWMPEDEYIDLTNPWNPVVTTDIPLTYIVTVSDTTFGCVVMDTINIEVYPELNLTINPQDTTLCASAPVTFTANTDFPPTSVAWFALPGDTPIGTGMSVTYQPPAGTSQVYAVAMSGDGCTERDTADIFNYPLDVTITDTLIICEPTATVDLSVINNAADQDITVAWNPEGVLTDLDEFTVTVDPNVTNTFSATVTNQFGCSEVLTTSVTVIDLMGDLDIMAEPDTVLIGEESTITVTGCVGCSYDWDPPADDSPVIVVTPGEDGTGEYEYWVRVNLLGCEEDLMTTIYAIDGTCDVDHVYLPNAFTPNNDGKNDVLRLRSNFLSELTEVDFFIYNRWGEEMFRTTDATIGWDGTHRGEQLPPDVYGFYLRVLCPNGEELIQKGNITLLR